MCNICRQAWNGAKPAGAEQRPRTGFTAFVAEEIQPTAPADKQAAEPAAQQPAPAKPQP